MRPLRASSMIVSLGETSSEKVTRQLSVLGRLIGAPLP